MARILHFAAGLAVQILVASFRPDTTHERAVAVAYIYCEAHRVTVAPIHSALEGTAPIAWLRQLVEGAGTNPYATLVSLRLPDWTFDAASIH